MGWIGYFYVVGPYGDHLDAVAPWTNWAHIHTSNTLNLPATEALAQRFQALDMQACYSITPLLWIPQTAPLPYVLHPDWQQRFNAQRGWYDAFHSRGLLHSLYVADEPTANGVTEADLRTVCDWLHAETPYKTMVVEQACHEISPPPNVDFYSLAIYTPHTMAQTKAVYVNQPNANVLLVQAFNEIPNPIPDQWAWYSLWNVVKDRPNAGMALFTFPNYSQGQPGPQQRHYIGSVGDHGVRAVHAQIARQITEDAN